MKSDLTDLENKIVSLVDNLKTLMNKNMPYLTSEVNRIINEKEQNIHYIERTLDTLLDYGQMGIGKKQFKRLIKYYKTISVDNAKEYEEFYKEMNEN